MKSELLHHFVDVSLDGALRLFLLLEHASEPLNLLGLHCVWLVATHLVERV